MSKASSSSSSNLKYNVLLVGKDILVREITCKMLSKLKVRCESASDYNNAVSIYNQQHNSARPFDGVIIDVDMFGGDEAEDLIERIKEINSKVGVVLFSRTSSGPLMMDYGNNAIRGRVIKPFELDELRIVLHNLLDGEEVLQKIPFTGEG